MRHLTRYEIFLIFILPIALLLGCKDEIIVKSQGFTEPFEMSAAQYSRNYFFVDTSYIPFYEPYYNGVFQIVLDYTKKIEEIEVWLERSGTGSDPTDRLGTAWLDLPDRPSLGYDSSFVLPTEIPGERETATFYQLNPLSVRLEADGAIGVISLSFLDLPDVTIGVAYRLADGTQYGDFLEDKWGQIHTSPIVLKMLKPRDLFVVGPEYPVPWEMQLKNTYTIRWSHVSRHNFDLNIFRAISSETEVAEILGHPLIQSLGLDRFNEDWSMVPDGKFDFRIGTTIDQDNGTIHFPELRPFDQGIQNYFNALNISVPDSLLFRDIYEKTQDEAVISEEARYVIRGSAIFN